MIGTDRKYFTNFDRTPKGTKVPASHIVSIFTAPVHCGASEDELVIVMSKGTALGSSSVEGWSLDFSCKKWECTLNKPDDSKTHHEVKYAAYDRATDKFVCTFDAVLTGIVCITLSKLREEARTSPIGGHQFQWFISPYNNPNRSFMGIAIDGRNEIIYCCNDHIGHKADVGAWSAVDGKFLEACHITKPEAIAHFKPTTCALNKQGDLFIIADMLHSAIFLFSRSHNGQQHTFLATLAVSGSVFGRYKDLGHVRHPEQVSFDPHGNILVVDGGNAAVKIFNQLNNGDAKTYHGVWCSRQITGMPKCACFVHNRGKDMVLIGTKVEGAAHGLYFLDSEPFSAHHHQHHSH